MTAGEAYNTDLTFRVLVDQWVSGRRCPLPLADRCLDFGMEAQADCARWAATEPERPVVCEGYEVEDRGASFPYPGLGAKAPWGELQHRWAEADESYGRDLPTARNVPAGRAPNLRESETVLAAILWLLDNWKPA